MTTWNKYATFILLTITITITIIFLPGCSRELREGENWVDQPLDLEKIPIGTESSVQPSVAGPDAVEALMDGGRDAYNRGDFPMAIEYFTGVLEKDENHVKALYNLGRTYRQVGDLDRAVDFSRRAVEIDPDMLFVHQNLALAYQEQDNIDAAITEYEEELLRHPDEPQLAQMTERLALIYLDRGLRQEAFDAAMHAVTLEPEVASHHAAMAEVHMFNGAWELAIDKWIKVIELLPDGSSESGSYLVRFGDALWEAGRHEEARRSYKEAIALDSNLEKEIESGRLD